MESSCGLIQSHSSSAELLQTMDASADGSLSCDEFCSAVNLAVSGRDEPGRCDIASHHTRLTEAGVASAVG